MKKLKIFIDYAGDVTIADQIKKKLIQIDGISLIQTYDDLDTIPRTREDNEWEGITLTAIKNHDIIIPLLSEMYLDFISPNIESKFEEIIESNDKFLIPILKTPSEWSSHKWVVRGKLFPENGKAFSQLEGNEFENEINSIAKTIKNIVQQINDKSNSTPVKEISNEDKNWGEQFIFISHNHDDGDFAELIKSRVEKLGIKCWIDTERLKIGQDWREGIDIGIQNCIAVIAIMTPEARKSEYVTYEWAFAWGKGKKIFPIMLKQTQLHPRLESLQYLDFTNRISRPWDELINSISKLLKIKPKV